MLFHSLKKFIKIVSALGQVKTRVKFDGVTNGSYIAKEGGPVRWTCNVSVKTQDLPYNSCCLLKFSATFSNHVVHYMYSPWAVKT